jgi:DedD protein
MATAQQDTEITLGTGRMLAIFFGFILVCAFFFAIGFSLGRKTTISGALIVAPSANPATVVRPSATKTEAHPAAPQSGDFSFYKSVGEKDANSALAPADSKTQATASTATADSPKAAPDATSVTPASGAYFVQVAAVTRKEDADSLVEALKKKQYPAFSANTPPNDKFYHVQVGPYADLKEAEAMRARLIGDGYNPIVKK